MRYRFIEISLLALLFCASLPAMEDALDPDQDDEKEYYEQEALALARISLRASKNSTRNDELYRDLFANAAHNHYHKLADFMLEHIQKKDPDKDLVPIMSKSFSKAAATGNSAFIQRALETKIPNRKKSRALYEAAKNGHSNVILQLLAAGADPNFRNRKTGETALLAATRLGHSESVHALLVKGTPNKNIKQFFLESFNAHKWKSNYFTLLPAELRLEVVHYVTIIANHRLTDKMGRNALEIAREREENCEEELKDRYGIIIKILELQDAVVTQPGSGK